MKKALIIGAGISGLTAGIYALKNGYEAEIYEMHSITGGECTGWNRGKYHFDGCIHWLMGSKKGEALNRIWREVGALDETVDIYHSEYFGKYELDGRELYLYRDVDRLEKHLLMLSPADKDEIRSMCKAIRGFEGMSMPVGKPFDMMKFGDIAKMMIKMLPYMSTMKYNKIDLGTYAARFRDPLIRTAITGIMSDKYSATSFLSTLASFSGGESGWPVGGSRKMAQRIEEKYKALGGELFLNSRVDKIIVEDGAAKGLRLSNGQEVSGDFIISATDGHEALYDLLDGVYLSDLQREMYTENKDIPLTASFQVWAGIGADLSNEPEFVDFELPRPLTVGGHSYKRIAFKNYCFDKSMAPEGCSVLTTFFYSDDFDWWKELYADKQAYAAEKLRIADAVKEIIETRFPAACGKVEQMDVATPMTYVRYCNAWRGSWMTWMMTPSLKTRMMPMKLNGLGGFVMAGQWIMAPGGLPVAAMTGRWAIQHLCDDDKKPFISE